MAQRPRVYVREGRHGRELRIHGTLASRLAPGRGTGGAVWDALALPILALPPQRRRRVLILGLGGGSVARIVRPLAPAAMIVGVEKDREVLRAARLHFGLDALGLELRCEDAADYLRRERRRFDLVVEDVFVGNARSVHKPEWVLEWGLVAAARLLATGGVLAVNTIHEGAQVARRLSRLGFRGLAVVEVKDYWNRIFVGSDTAVSGPALRGAARASGVFRQSLPGLRFRTLRSSTPVATRPPRA